MKKYVMFAVTVACVALSSCVKDKEKDFADDQVSFSAQTGTIETRTAYGAVSEEIQVGGKYVQYVNWVTGDEITIVSSAGGSDDYTITLDHVGSDALDISKANVSPKGGGIAWGKGVQTFYAMYPAANSTLGSSLSATDGMTCVIPATWTPARATELGQLPYGYMFAKTDPISRTTNVSLTFNSKFSAFCFTLTNSSTTEPVTLSSLKLESGSKAMSGIYYVASDGTLGNSFPTFSDGVNNSVTVDFASLSGLTIDANSSATFTVATLPQVFNDLTLYVTKSGGGTKKLQLKKGSSWIEFAALKKHNINVTLPEFGSFDYDFQVVNPTDLTYSGGTAHASIVSTKTKSGGSAQSASWTVEGYYTDAACTTLASGYTSFLPNGIDNGSGGGNGDISFSYAAATPSAVSSNYQSVAEADIAASTFGSGSSTSKYLNLSNPTNMESDYIRESANSYIVNGVGFYKIPLVMGNGVKFNRANTAAYDGTNFINYKGTTVSSTGPYLHNTGSNPSAAYVVWEDVSGLIEADASYNLAGTPIVEGSNGVYWLRFHVNQAKQGNAVIAVTDGTNVMWSYHIWVTNYIPQNYPGYNNYDSYPGNGPHKIMPVNLGWIYANAITATGNMYPGECIYAKLVQSGSGSIAIMKIDRPRHSEVYAATTFADNEANPTGSSPYYQWGRKDPLLPALNGSNVTSFGKVTGLNTINNSGATIATGISNPGKFITGSATNNSYWWGAYNASDNKSDLWNLESSNYSTSVKKTIYDPCPASYCMPSQNLFNPTYEGNQSIVSTLYYLKSGVQDKSSKVYHYNLGQRSYSSGGIANASVTPSSIANVTGFYYLATSSMKTWGTYSIRCPYLFYFRNYGYRDSYTVNNTGYLSTAGFSVRPMQDPTFDPTDDGTFRSTGPDINWVN